jgi:hypothetical protein
VINNGGGACRLTLPSGQVPATATFVVVSGVQGVPGANGTFTGSFIDTTHFDLSGSSFSGSYVSGGILSTQANATPITTQWTRVPTGATGTGVRLPTGTAGGQPSKVKNATSNDGLIIWGVTGASINNIPVNQPYSAPNNWTIEFWATSTTQWDTQP